jgi:hypothetical protein
VQHTTEYLDAMWELREGAEREGLPVSDRRWVELDQFAHANAWLAGRDHLIAEDVAVMEFGMAREKSHMPIAHKLVLPYHGRYEAGRGRKAQRGGAAHREVGGDPRGRGGCARNREGSTRRSCGRRSASRTRSTR